MKTTIHFLMLASITLELISQNLAVSHTLNKNSQVNSLSNPQGASQLYRQISVTAPAQKYDPNVAGIAIAYDNSLEELKVVSEEGVTTDLKVIAEVDNFKKFEFKQGMRITMTIGIANSVNPGVYFSINSKANGKMIVTNSNNSIICDESTAKMIPKFTETDLSGNFHPEARWISTSSKNNDNSSIKCIVKL